MTASETQQNLLKQAADLRVSAYNLDMALLAPSMASRAMREDADNLEAQAQEIRCPAN